MAEETCAECTARYAVGAPQCPHCASARRLPEGTLTALVPCLKVACANGECSALGIVRRIGLTQVMPGVLLLPTLLCAACGLVLANVNEEEESMPKITVHGGVTNAAADDAEGGEDVSAGTSSTTSSEKEPTSPEQSENKGPSPARKTASRSKKGQTGSSSAASTDGGRTAPSSDSDEDDA